ncbi:AAA family ATPase, partial [Acinetobacter baumannii]
HHIRTAAGLFSDPSIRPREAIFGDWLLERGLAMVYAPSGIGKSWLSLSIATAVAGGGGLHEWTTPAAERVLLVDGEMD